MQEAQEEDDRVEPEKFNERLPEKTQGYSKYFNNNGEFEWRECEVLCQPYQNEEHFLIRWLDPESLNKHHNKRKETETKYTNLTYMQSKLANKKTVVKFITEANFKHKHATAKLAANHYQEDYV